MILGGVQISNDYLENPKYWIFKLDSSYFRPVHDNLILKSESNKNINKLNKNDKIILFSKINIKNTNRMCFIGFTEVESIFTNDEKIYGKKSSKRKLKLKGIKYFNEPVIIKDLNNSFDFIEKLPSKTYPYKAKIREISSNDFKLILNSSPLSDKFPIFLDKLSFDTEEFLLGTLKSELDILKLNNNQIEIKDFLKIFKTILTNYGINKTNKEIEDFYSKNAWKLAFEHYPSRSSTNHIVLYSKRGHSKKFSHIKLN